MDLALNTDRWEFVLPINPESVDIDIAGVSISWQSIQDGVFEIPAGRQPQGVNFKVLLPGEFTIGQLFPHVTWLDTASFKAATDVSGGVLHNNIAGPPLAYIDLLQDAIETGHGLVYAVCGELNVNGTYRLKSFTAHHAGAHGDVEVSLSLAEFRSPSVTILNQPVTYGAPTASAPLGTANGTPIAGPTPTQYGQPTVSAPLGTVNGVAIQGPLPAGADGNPAQDTAYTTGDSDTLYTIAARVPGVTDPNGYALAIWIGNSDTITAAGGQQDGTLPTGLTLQLP